LVGQKVLLKVVLLEMLMVHQLVVYLGLLKVD
jgi:hypothetical protein